MIPFRVPSFQSKIPVQRRKGRLRSCQFITKTASPIVVKKSFIASKREWALTGWLFSAAYQKFRIERRRNCPYSWLNRLCLRPPMIGGPFPLLVEVAKLVEADLDRKISGRSFENRGRGRIGFDSRYTRCGESDWFNDDQICYLKLVVYFQEMFGRENLQYYNATFSEDWGTRRDLLSPCYLLCYLL